MTEKVLENSISEKNIDIINNSCELEKLDTNIIKDEILIKPEKRYELTDLNTYLFHEGKSHYSYEFMGAHVVNENGVNGVRFTTWAPNAKNVFVIRGSLGIQIKKENKMNRVTDLGLWSIFIPDANSGEKYKLAIETWNGEINYKADPYAFSSELRPGKASIITDKSRYNWNDTDWMSKRHCFNMYESPINIYEMHLGSWKRNDGNFLSYKELAEKLPQYLIEMGYTHVEFMPVSEHPLDESWGYQVTGYYSATSRYGSRDDLKFLIDKLHCFGIGVILDWVPGHFCIDDHGLYMFDGTPTYEYSELWKGKNKHWGTCNFDLGRPEVKSFLISNAVYWLKEFHVDGLRVDAVSNMLYLNYGMEDGEWRSTDFTDDGFIESIQFIKELNAAVKMEIPNTMMIAEESTSRAKVSHPIEEDGLGFDFKWNLGWMHDTLDYVQCSIEDRKHNHSKMTFPMMYHKSEHFVLPISHDEVVHCKKSLLNKMWGNDDLKYAELRLYAANMIGHPGKKLLFMGSEFGQHIEWRDYEELQWSIIEKYTDNKKIQHYFKVLNKFYKENKALWELDYDDEGFSWIDANNYNDKIYSFIRKGRNNHEILVFVCNYAPIAHYDFRVGVSYPGEYEECFNSDNLEFGGLGQVNNNVLTAEEISYNYRQYSININVPPMAAVVFKLKS